MRVLLWVIELAVFVPLLMGIDRIYGALLGGRWPGMSAGWLLIGGALLALVASGLAELELKKRARRDAVRAGKTRRM